MREMIGTIGAIVIGLILLALIGVTVLGGTKSGKASNFVSGMAVIQSKAREGFAQSNNGYTNFTTANAGTMINNHDFPTTMVKGGVLVDLWGNGIQLSSANNGSQGVITFGGGGSEDAEQCKSVVTGLKDYVTLNVAGTIFTQSNQPDGATAGAACAIGAAGITITFA